MSVVLRKACRHSTKRGARMIHGRVESAWVVKLVDNTATYRVYADWTLVEPERLRIKAKDRKPVPLVVIVKGEKHILTLEQHAQLEGVPVTAHWVEL